MAIKTQSQLTVAVEAVTPAMAAEWLTVNHSNRALRARLVSMLTREILNGNWQLTGEAIKIDKTGALIDGQHRLSAIVKADQAVEALVVRGLPVEVQKVLDTGAKRNAGDVLKMAGFNSTNRTAATTRLLFLYDEGLLYDYLAQAVSNTDILNYATANQEELQRTVNLAYRATRTAPSHMSAMAAAVFLTHRVDGEASDEFFESLATGVGLTAGSPILALTSRLRELERKRVRLNNVDHLSLILRAWNIWRSGKTVAHLYLYSPSDQKPIKVPSKLI